VRVEAQRLLGGGRGVEPPLPDPRLIYSVCGTEESSWYLESGTFAAQEIRGALERSGARMEKLRRILDFGCGSARILRHWRTLRGPALYGTDYNPELVAWCDANLPFARFSVNTLDGPLSYRSRTFDLVYAFSVFTHLTEAQQRHWIDELGRILRPGGYLYLTTHGEFYLPHVPADQRDHFRRGGLVVTGGELAGTNVCAAFHPEPYVLNVLAPAFRCLEFAPGRYPQDAYLLQKD
jgi:SAM-dependent methyltransferase